MVVHDSKSLAAFGIEKVSNMISREPIWHEVRKEKTLDLQGFHGVA